MTQTTTAPAAVAKAPSSSLSAARRKLQAALDAIDHTDVTYLQARKAHVMATGAAGVLEQHLATRTAADLAAQRAHARELARTMRAALEAGHSIRSIRDVTGLAVATIHKRQKAAKK